MKLIGLTGGIASGKSTACEILQTAGFVVLSADRIAREVVAPGQPAYTDIVETFGTSILQPDTTLDRNRLAQIIFANPSLRATLNTITHPRIAQQAAARMADYAQQGCRVLIYEVPLLFETHIEAMFDLIILIAVSPEIQCLRLQQRDQISQAEAEARIRSQMPLADKKQKAHIIVENHGSFDEFQQADRKSVV